MSQELYKELQEKVKTARVALEECEAFADEHGLSFSFNPAYGMGGRYYSKKSAMEDYGLSEDKINEEQYGWRSSSQNC